MSTISIIPTKAGEKAKIETTYNESVYVTEMEKDDQHIIKLAVVSSLCYEMDPNSSEFEKAISDALDSRLQDLKDTIIIDYKTE